MRPRLEEELIYKTAIPFFAKYGYKKTTLDDIAGALNMSNTNLYSYAKSKRDLYNGCIDYVTQQWQNYVFSETSGIEDPKEKLLHTFRSAVLYIVSNEDILALLKSDPNIFPMFPAIDFMEEYNDWSVQYTKSILEEGIEKGVFRPLNVDIASTILFNYYKYIIITSLDVEPGSEVLEATLSTMSTLLFEGLLADSAE